MSCEDFSSAIGEQVDGTLEGERARALDQHLATCTACRALLADLRRIRQTAATLDRQAPPPAVWTRLSEQLRRERTERQRRAGTWRMGLAAAATLLLLLGGVLAWRPMFMRQSSQTVASNAPASGGVPRSDTPTKDVQSVETELRLAAEHYEKAIAGLEAIARTLSRRRSIRNCRRHSRRTWR